MATFKKQLYSNQIVLFRRSITGFQWNEENRCFLDEETLLVTDTFQTDSLS